MRHALLEDVDGFVLSLSGAVDEGPDLCCQQVRSAPRKRRRVRPFFAEELSEQAASAPARARVDVGRAARELWNRVRLDVVGASQRTQVLDELLLVARREQRGQEDDIGDSR